MAGLLSTQSYYSAPMALTGRKRGYGDPEVGRRLQTFRKLKGLKQETLAALWRTDRNVVGAYEAGRRRLQVDKARILADKYRDLDLNWLLLGRGAPPGSEASEALAAKLAELERRVQKVEELPVITEALARIEVRLEEEAIAADRFRTHPDRPETPSPR